MTNKNLSNENILHIKNGWIEYLQFKKLLEYKDKIQHCYTLKPLDYRKGNENNYKKLYKDLQLDYSKFVQIQHQVHSNFVEVVFNEKKQYTNIDGLITNIKGISLSLRYADCTPIYLYDPIKNVIGNIHSWRKWTIKKIAIQWVINMIKSYNSNPQDIIACLWPSIGKCHFEVDEDVKNIFQTTFSYMNEDKIIEKWKIKNNNQKYFIDTNTINKRLLEDVWLKTENIIESNICTVCNATYIHSYRADKDKNWRNVAIIWLRE